MKLHTLLAGLALLLPTLSQAAGNAGSCRYVPVAKLPIEYSDASHRAIVTGTVNNKPARMIVDTGIYETFLSREGAERLGLPLDTTGKALSGMGGTSVIYATRVDDFSVGIAHSGRTAVKVIGNSAKLGGDAVVGTDFLLQTDMELSLADKYLQFFRASGCGDTVLAYWDSNAMEIPFSGKDGPTNTPYVTVELNGVKLKAILDTGAPHSSVSRHGAELAGIRIGDPGVRQGGKTGGIGDEWVDTWFATFDSFSIGPESMKRVELVVHDDSSRGRLPNDVILGVDFLRAHRILFAMSQDRLYMSYLGRDPFPPLTALTAK